MKKTNLVFLIAAIVFIVAAFVLVSCAYSTSVVSTQYDSGLGFVFSSSSYEHSYKAELLNLYGRMCFTLGLILFVSFAIMSINNVKNYYYEIIDDEYPEEYELDDEVYHGESCCCHSSEDTE